MTTVTFDVSYGTRAVPFRLPYLAVHRRGPARADRRRSLRTARTVDRALAARDAALDRALALRAGL